MEVGRWDNHRLHAILQPHYPGVHFLKNIEWSLSMAGKPRVLAINALLHSLAALTATYNAVAFYCYFYDASHRQSEFCANLMYQGSLHLSCKRDQIKIRDYMDRQVTPSKWAITTPTWGPPPPCKQALKNCIHAAFQTLFLNRPYSISFNLPNAGEVLFSGLNSKGPCQSLEKQIKIVVLRSGTP